VNGSLLAAADGEFDLCEARSANHAHGFVEGDALKALAVHGDDDVARLQSRFLGGAVGQGSHDACAARGVFQQRANPREAACGVLLHAAEGVGIHKARVGVFEGAEHSVDAGVGQLIDGGRLAVEVRFHFGERAAESVRRLQRLATGEVAQRVAQQRRRTVASAPRTPPTPRTRPQTAAASTAVCRPKRVRVLS
jgi:hypothetical protein